MEKSTQIRSSTQDIGLLMSLLHKMLGFFSSLVIIVKGCINMSHMVAPSVNVLISSRGYDPLEQVIIIVKGCSLMMCPLGKLPSDMSTWSAL
jgi:hypothetical protein